MKKLILLLLLAFGMNAFAQDSEYLKLWDKYHDECSVIVSDTTIENGTVTYDINPESGELKLIPIDTTWNVIECSEFKEINFHPISWGSTSSIYCDTISSYCYVSARTIGNSYISRSEKEKFTTSITREKICRMKLRQPTRDGFWVWLKENGYRK